MTIVGLVFSSAVIGAVISSIMTLYVTERNFRNEYYKKIIEKRFQARNYSKQINLFVETTVPDKDEDPTMQYYQETEVNTKI